MSFGSVKKVTVEATGDTDWVPMGELVGDTVAFDLKAFEPVFQGKYGPTPRATVDLVVTTGDHKGLVERNRYLNGNIASQLSGALDAGESTIVVVASGASGKGNPWVGIESLDDSEYEAAAKQLKKILKKGRK